MKFKKITGMLTALACISTMGFPMVAQAYAPCDLNQDNHVDILDVIVLNKYLRGRVSEDNYDKFDLNGSYTVDAEDVMYLLNAIVGTTYTGTYISRYHPNNSNDHSDVTVSFPPATNTHILASNLEPLATNSNDLIDARVYRKHLYSSNSTTSYTTYVLPTITETPTSQIGDSPNAIVDGSNTIYRATGSENTGIVNVTGVGTGFIVGDHQIATCAHCVTDKTNYYSDIEIKTYNSNGELSTTLHPVEVHVPEKYCTTTNYSIAAYDYALVTVSDDLSSYVHFSLGQTYNLTASTISSWSTIPIFVTGRAGQTSNGTNSNQYLYSEEGHALIPPGDESNDTYINHLVYYNTDTWGGDSGAPVYTITRIPAENEDEEDTYTYTAIAIHSGGITGARNWGARIKRHHLQFFLNNPNAYNGNGTSTS